MSDYFMAATSEMGAQTIEHGPNKVCSEVSREDSVFLLQNTAKKHIIINAVDVTF